MNIVLSPEIEQLIKGSAARGEFSSSDESFSQAAQFLLARRKAEPFRLMSSGTTDLKP